MNKFLKHIFRTDSTEPEPGPEVPENPKIGGATITRNNSCETVFEGSYQIPTGKTGTLTGTVLDGQTGGGVPGNNGANMLIGSFSVSEGTFPYSVNLGNSGQNGVASRYSLRILLDGGGSAASLFQRDETESAFYDKSPC